MAPDDPNAETMPSGEPADMDRASRPVDPLGPTRDSSSSAPPQGPGRVDARGPLGVGDQLGRYRLERVLGAGGMGEVFAARHVDSGQVVALKTLSSAVATHLYRFKREFRALADISHRNVIRLHELVVSDAGPAFFTMELLDGVPFVEWIRDSTPAGELPDLTRLEQGLRQLIAGVRFLHEHDRVHRDLKPSNVLVTTEGRVVVLDFGLVVELSEPDNHITREHQILGTPAYMSPEQALGRQVGPPADYYAIGVMLFQCLTGGLPHAGSAFQQLVAKEDTTVDPANVIASIPGWLRTLCGRMMARDPSKRPSGPEISAQLRVSDASVVRSSTFVGRREQLGRLHAALHDARERTACIPIHVRGRSGSGKSALMRRFRAEQSGTGAVVLHARCREQETVPYKGVDALVDALSAHLRRLPADERTALRPPDVGALVRLFAVLDQIWERPKPHDFGPDEVRALGAVALRHLLRAAAEAHPLVLHIDDFQWADEDSVSLLETIARPPDDAAMLIVLSYRSESDESVALRALSSSETLAGPASTTLEVGPLSPEESRELASALLVDAAPDSRPRRVEAIALRSRGSPFFITQMSLAADESYTDERDLDQVVIRRLSRLDDRARRLLEVVAVFGGPLPTSLALELCEAADASTVDALCEHGLLVRERRERHGGDPIIETAHDRVREVVTAQLGVSERLQMHWRIGEALRLRHESASIDAFAIVEHLRNGLDAADELSDERRREIAEFGRAAGQRALESAAWVATRQCFDFAYALVSPWIDEARVGRGHHELCVEVAFGRARAAVMMGDAVGEVEIKDMLGWVLSMPEYCRIANWYCTSLALALRPRDCVVFVAGALAHMGIRVPRRPSWIRAILSFMAGWRAVMKVGVEGVVQLPRVEDERMRVALEILGGAAVSAVSTDLKVHLMWLGRYFRLLVRHGLHDNVPVSLAALAIMAVARGKIRDARMLREAAERLVVRLDAGSFTRHGMHAQIMLALPLIEPLRAAVEAGAQFHEQARDVAPRPMAEIIGCFHVGQSLSAGVPLARVDSMIRQMEQDPRGIRLAWIADVMTVNRRCVRSLERGRMDIPVFDRLDHLEDIPFYMVAAMLQELMVATLLGDHGGAWEVMQQLVYERWSDVRGTIGWVVPDSLMLGVVAIVEQWPRGTGPERRRMRRALRRSRALVRRWASRCPENFRLQAEMVDAELARLRGRADEAMARYEGVRASAVEEQQTWRVGLASERLASLAHDSGQPLLTGAALDAALQAYEAWGAHAVVRRLEQERLRFGLSARGEG